MNTIINKANNNHTSFVIGGAGTGKSTIIKQLITQNPDDYIVIAYTNNAINIIQEKLQSSTLVLTIHRLLGLYFTFTLEQKEVMVTNLHCCEENNHLIGKQYDHLFKCCKRPFNTSDYINKYIIIDECSFISHELHYLLQKIVCKGFIMFGDNNQLGSINIESCRVCNKANCKFNIFDAATNTNTTRLYNNYRNNTTVQQIIQTYNTKHQLNIERINCKSILNSNQKLTDPILCYRNTTVNYINKIFSNARNIPIPGEAIFFLSGSSQMIVSKKYIVKACSDIRIMDKLFGELDVLYIQTDKNVYSIKDQSQLDNIFFPMLAKLDKQKIDQELYITARRALIHAYKAYINPWAFAYAITVHKSQGSTYENSYLYMADFTRLDSKIKYKLLYTALTRASSNIYNMLIPSKWIL